MVEGEHHGARDRGMVLQHRADLVRLDPDPADLDLVVDPAEVLQQPVLVAAHHVPGAVQPGARAGRVGDEPLRRQVRASHVGVRDLDAADVELAHHAGGHRPQPAVEHRRGHPGGRGAQRDHAALGDLGERGVAGDLGGAVEVAQDGGGRDPAHPLGRGRGERLPRRDPGPQRRERTVGRRHGVGQRRHGEQVRDAATGDRGEQRRRVRRDPVGHDHDRRARDERAEQLGHGVDEPGTALGDSDGPGPVPEHLPAPGEPVHQRTVREHHTLGHTGGARREEDARGVVRGDRARRGERRCRCGAHVVEEEHVGAGSGRGHGDDQVRAGLGEDPCDALRRVAGVDRDVRGPGAQDRGQHDHLLDRPRQEHGDAVRDPDPPPGQERGHGVDPRIELLVGEPGGGGVEAGAVDQRHRVGRGRGLRPQERVDGPGGALGGDGRVHRPADLDVGDPGTGVGGDGLEDLPQQRDNPGHDGGAEHVGPGREPEPDAVGGGQHGQGQRVVGRVADLEADDGEAGVGGGPADLVERVVLVHDDRVEQRIVPGGAVQLGERHVMVIEHAGVVLLDLPDQLAERRVRAEGHGGRDGVEEQADRLLDAVDLGGPARDDGAEDDGVLPRERVQHDAPRGLDEGAQGRVGLPCGPVERGGQLRVDLEQVLVGERRLSRPRTGRDQGGFLDARQRPRPAGHRHGLVPVAQPPQEVPVGVVGGGRRLRPVGLDQGPHQARDGPPVGQHVVHGEHRRVRARSAPDEAHPQQGARGQVERRGTVTIRDAPHGRGVAGVVDRERHGHCGGHDGDELATGGRDDGGTQGRIPVDDDRERAPEPLGIEVAAGLELEHRLGDVDVDAVRRAAGRRGAADEGLDGDALLQRGQRLHVGERAEPGLPPVDVGLGHTLCREVGRGATHDPCALGEVPQGRQRAEPEVRDGPGIVLRNRRGGNVEGGHQLGPLAGAHDGRVDVDQRGQRAVGGKIRPEPGVLRCGRPVGALDGAEPAEVVEPDLRPVAHRAVGMQQPVPDPPGRHRPHLLLDPQHRVCRGGRIGHGDHRIDVHGVQSDREPRGEPPDRPRQVATGDQGLLAAVALQTHDDATVPTAAPRPDRDGQRPQQDVVHLGRQRRRNGRQHGPCDVRGQGHLETTRRPVGVLRRVQRAGPQQRLLRRHDLRPVVRLRRHVRVRRARGGRRRPRRQPRPHRQQLRGATGLQRPGRREVVAQDPPRHAVHHEVMDHPQQPALLREEHRPPQHTSLEIQRSRQLRHELVDPRQALTGPVDPQPVLGHEVSARQRDIVDQDVVPDREPAVH
ncbi:hypothetical protein GCM10009836_03790 [Pseudonocardia ailaonensis]|uniref:Uncharacterized protein n=1 Tax=Pseudonocardia ailaonensis TaxID=367279 RepID=A0ABN2MJ55_9PSEU